MVTGRPTPGVATFKGTKDPDAVLDWRFDWSDWLADGETISDHEVIAAGVEVDSASATGTAVTVWLSGGTKSTAATVTCRVTTNQGRTDDRTVRLTITDR